MYYEVLAAGQNLATSTYFECISVVMRTRRYGVSFRWRRLERHGEAGKARLQGKQRKHGKQAVDNEKQENYARKCRNSAHSPSYTSPPMTNTQFSSVAPIGIVSISFSFTLSLFQ
jgi:hypothetical protein